MTPEWALITALGIALTALAVYLVRHLIDERDEWRRIAKGYQVATEPMLRILEGDAPPPPSAGIARRVYLRSLRHMLETGLSMSDMDSLIFDMGLKPDDIAGDTISARARELIIYTDRRRIVGELVQVLKETRRELFTRDEATYATVY